MSKTRKQRRHDDWPFGGIFLRRCGDTCDGRHVHLQIGEAPVAERWCVYPNPIAHGNDWMPDEDKLIGQLLHLRAGPDALRAAANVFPAFR